MSNTIEARKVEEFNRQHPIGTPVTVHRDNGEKYRTKTRSAAQVMGGGAVIWVEGIAGCYRLDRVHVTEEQTA